MARGDCINVTRSGVPSLVPQEKLELPLYTGLNVPPAPLSGLVDFARYRCGMTYPCQINPSGKVFENLNVDNGRIHRVNAIGNGSSTTNHFGIATLAATGTATAAPSLTGSSVFGNFNRCTWVTAASSGSSAGVGNGSVRVVRGSAAGCGGFFIKCRFSLDDVTANGAFFVGVASTTTDIGNVEPSSVTNILGFGADSTNSNVQWMVNDGSGTATKTDLGSNFPAKTDGMCYEMRIFCLPNDSAVYYSLERLDVSYFAEGSSTSDLPSNTQLLTFQLHIGNLADAVAATIGMCDLMIKTDL